MAIVDVNTKLRPIRLAFLVNPNNAQQILDAIEINTFLWGGTFNPIVPAYRRLPSILKDSKKLTSSKLIEGYINAFDPDYIVVFDKETEKLIVSSNRKVLNIETILDPLRERNIPSLGISLYEILDHLAYKELKYVLRTPFDITFPRFGRKHQLFLASVFGKLSSDVCEQFEKKYKQEIKAEEVLYSIENYTDGFERPFIRQVSATYQLNIINSSIGGIRDAHLFYLDATKTIDIIDYWNLRASGLRVIPIPKQAIDFHIVEDFAVNFLNENYYPLKNNPKVFHSPTILKSRTISNKEFEDFSKKISSLAHKDNNDLEVIRQNFYPRMWDKWSIDQRQVTICSLISKSDSQELNSIDERISINSVEPEFSYKSHYEPRFANEVSLRIYSDSELYAEVIPEGGEELAEVFGYWRGIREVRFSKKGIVRLRSGLSHRESLFLPKSEDVFIAWLKAKQWKVKVSDKGRIAKQMFKQLGGKRGINILALDGIIRLLEKFSEGKSQNDQYLNAELAKIAQQQSDLDARFILQRLTEVQMFRLGIELVCPVCTQRSWYSISDADYQLQCSKCLEAFLIPSYSPKEIKWSYRSFGSFSLPKQAYGAYSVLLTLRFFSTILMDSATTPIMSFNATKDGKEIEADLGILFQRTNFRQTDKTKAIFVECKTYNSFEKKDVQRMQFIGDQFPNCILVFATLKKELTEKEKRFIKQIVIQSRSKQRIGKPFNPILILTGIELLSTDNPPSIWKNIQNIDEKFLKWYSVDTDLIHLSDATQQIHLGMEGYEYLPLEEPF
jgi:hypothetical protein